MRLPFAGSARAIDDSPALRAYAVVLSCVHALIGASWFTYKHVATLVTGEDCVCWPVFPGCETVRGALAEEGVRAAVVAYAALGLVAGGLFAGRRPRAGLGAFVGAACLGTAVYALDYRMRTNQAYMFGWVALALLLARRKTAVLQALVALFYAWAGTLKLNGEWIRGAALYERPYLVPEALLPAACVYVLVLEMVLVWGLFSTRPRLRWAVYAQLLLFHAVSWRVVGYFYPLLMLGLTAIYPLVWLLTPGEALTWTRRGGDRDDVRAAGRIAALFSAFQIVPHAFPGDTALTGEGRLFALHMFDARAQCAGGAILRGASRGGATVSLINEHLDARTRCDPIVLLAYAQQLCRNVSTRRDVARVDVAVDARRSSDAAMRPLVRVSDFCRQPIRYSVLSHNEWIETR